MNTCTTPCPDTRLLKVNGVAKLTRPPSNALIIHHDIALKLLLTAEAIEQHSAALQNELPSIISCWLYAPKPAPDRLNPSYSEKWLSLLRYHVIESSRNPASGPKKPTKHPKPVYIDFSKKTKYPEVTRLPAFTIGHETALKLLLTLESKTDFNAHIRSELPAIISHWLQNISEPPILVETSFAKKWLQSLQAYSRLEAQNNLLEPAKEIAQAPEVNIVFAVPFPPKSEYSFTFIDLFAGIGGFRIALEALGGKCVFSSEWDPKAKETYFQNYGEVPFGDITQFTKTQEAGNLTPEHIPNHDTLCGGFPCQPFSQAGKQLGFEDARGTLFFDILKIAEAQRPRVLFLENVKRLKGHDKGKTFTIICNALKEIGYTVHEKVIRAYDQGVPQNRERIFIVAFSEPIEFEFPKDNRHSVYKKLGDIFEKEPDEKYTISDRMWDGHQRRKEGHKTKGNGFGYSLFKGEHEYANTISARYWKDGSEILIEQKDKNPRVLTPRECARLQGYPEAFQPHDSKRHAYQQFGNSVAVPVIKAISKQIQTSLTKKSQAMQVQQM